MAFLSSQNLGGWAISSIVSTTKQVSAYVEEAMSELGNAFVHMSGDINIGNLHLSSCLSANSLFVGNKCNVGNDNIISSAYSAAIGQGNIVGIKGYVVQRVVSVDTETNDVEVQFALDSSESLDEQIVTGFKVSSTGFQRSTVEFGVVKSIDHANGKAVINIPDQLIRNSLTSKTLNFADAAGRLVNVGNVIASGAWSVAEGYDNTVVGACAHVEGYLAQAIGTYAHSEGKGCTAGWAAHAEGCNNRAFGNGSHAQNRSNKVSQGASYSSVEGTGTVVDADKKCCHAAGYMARAKDEGAFVWNGATVYCKNLDPTKALEREPNWSTGWNVPGSTLSDDDARVQEFIDHPAVLSTMYASHGEGTFNINPEGGADGFYIGEQNFAQCVSAITEDEFKQLSSALTLDREVHDESAENLFTTTLSTSYDANLQIVPYATPAYLTMSADVSEYVGGQIQFYAYGYCGFKCSNGTVSSVAQYKDHYNAGHGINVLDIPEDAVSFHIMTGSANAYEKTGQKITVTKKTSIITQKMMDYVGTSPKDFNQSLGIDSFVYLDKNIGSLAEDGILSSSYRNMFMNENKIRRYPVDDEWLNENGISNVLGISTRVASGSELKLSENMYASLSSNTLIDRMLALKDKNFAIEILLYSKHKQFPTATNTTVRMYSNALKFNTNVVKVEDTESDYVKKVTMLAPAPTTWIDKADINYLNITLNAGNASADYEVGEYGFTAIRVGAYEGEIGDRVVVGDWIVPALEMKLPVIKEQLYGDEFAKYVKSIVNEDDDSDKPFNKVSYNRQKTALFINMLNNKFASNETNRLVVSFNGDSIFGTQVLGAPSQSPEFDTGDFPPNMSRMTVARKFFDRYHFSDEDVKFRNLKHADWTKSGFSTYNGYNDGAGNANDIEVYGGNAGDYAEIHVSNAKYVKFVWSEIKPIDYAFSVMQSVDGSEYELLKSYSVSSQSRVTTAYDIVEIDPTKTYSFKVVLGSNAANAQFWGIEYWTNPRLDVVVEATSGAASSTDATHLQRYWNEYHQPHLVISDILALNDWTNQNYNDWISNNNTIYDYCKSKHIPMLMFGTQKVLDDQHNQVLMGPDLVRQSDLALVDILAKISCQGYAPDQPIGIHLNDYGISYFFEELIRIFG